VAKEISLDKAELEIAMGNYLTPYCKCGRWRRSMDEAYCPKCHAEYMRAFRLKQKKNREQKDVLLQKLQKQLEKIHE
jgi:hypothetical protein